MTTKIKAANDKIPTPTITAMFFIGYFPINVTINTIENIKAVVEKLDGKISINVKKTGAHNSNADLDKVMSSTAVLDKYLATNINNAIEAKADG